MRLLSVSGTMMRLTRIAAGADTTEAITKCAAASGITEEELVERLKGEFGAREVFDESEES